MGGTLTLWLATRHPEIAGIVPINAALLADPATVAQVQAAIAAGETTTDAVGGDVADPDSIELAYDRTPLRPLASLFAALDALRDRVGGIRCPALVVVSEQDHIVPPVNSERIAAALAGPVEKLVLQRSFHVATIDYDQALIAERAIAFARRVCGAGHVTGSGGPCRTHASTRKRSFLYRCGANRVLRASEARQGRVDRAAEHCGG